MTSRSEGDFVTPAGRPVITPRGGEDDYRPDRVALFYDAAGSEVYRLEAHDGTPGGAVDLEPPRTISRIEVHAAKDIYA